MKKLKKSKKIKTKVKTPITPYNHGRQVFFSFQIIEHRLNSRLITKV